MQEQHIIRTSFLQRKHPAVFVNSFTYSNTKSMVWEIAGSTDAIKKRQREVILIKRIHFLSIPSTESSIKDFLKAVDKKLGLLQLAVQYVPFHSSH